MLSDEKIELDARCTGALFELINFINNDFQKYHVEQNSINHKDIKVWINYLLLRDVSKQYGWNITYMNIKPIINQPVCHVHNFGFGAH